MANPSSRLSPALRSAIIAATMLALLAASLGAAYVVTRNRSHNWATEALGDASARVGDLKLALPHGWRRVSDPAPIPGLSVARTFEDPEDPDHRLVVGMLRTGLPEPPQVALTTAFHALMGNETDKGVYGFGDGAHSFSTATMVGVRGTIGTKMDDDDLAEHFMAAMTEDGRRHWVFFLTASMARLQYRVEGVVEGGTLLEAICRSAVDTGVRDAQPEDLVAAGLAVGKNMPRWPQGVRARVAASGPAGRPIHLLLPDGSDRVRLIQVRSIPDAGATIPSDPLSPYMLLSSEVCLMSGEPPAKDAVSEKDIAGGHVWIADIPRSAAAKGDVGITRQLWFVRPQAEASFLLEASAEPQMQTRLSNLIPQVIAALAPADATPGTPGTPEPPGTPGTPEAAATAPAPPGNPSATEPSTRPAPSDSPVVDRSEVRAAVTRGIELCSRVRSDLAERLAPGWRYELIERDGQLLGFCVMHAGELRPETLMPYHGMMAMGFPQGSTLAQWACGLDGLNFVVDTVENNPGATTEAARNQRFQFDRRGPEMGCAHGPFSATQLERWSMPAPEALLPPMALRSWPGELLHDPQRLPAIVWISSGGGPAIAYWLERQPFTPGEDAVQPPNTDSLDSLGALGDRDDDEPALPPIANPSLPPTPGSPGGPAGPAGQIPAQPAGPPEIDPAAELLLWPLTGFEPTRILLDAEGKTLRIDRNHQRATLGDPESVSYRTVDRATLLKKFPKLQAKLRIWDKKETTP